METILVVLRPKQAVTTVTRDFSPSAFDVLLTDVKIPGASNKAKAVKQLPKTNISYEQEPTDALFEYLYDLTGAHYGGIKGKRALFVPPARTEPIMDTDFSVRGTLYCLPLDTEERLNLEFVDNLPTAPGFYSFDLVLDSLNTSTLTFTKQTRVMLIRVHSWLKQKHNVPGSMDLLFASNAEDRLKRSITNPAFMPSHKSSHTSSINLGNLSMLRSRSRDEDDIMADRVNLGMFSDTVSRSMANEALAKMMAIEKCDLTIINPVFGTDLTYKAKVDSCAVNKYWGAGAPDYSKVTASGDHKKPEQHRNSSDGLEDYPLIKAAQDGDAKQCVELIQAGYSVTDSGKDKWMAIHYAAWYGHLEVLQVLLNEGECSPNVRNINGCTPLHVAAKKGKVYIIELLLNHPDIDVHAVDKTDKTALNLCENINKPTWQEAAELLHNAMASPVPKLQVFLMDGTFRMLTLAHGADTTVEQLHNQMLRELRLPPTCQHLFTLWICSRNLQLQLKPNHKPIQHLNDWKRKIVGMLTNQDSSREDPHIFWKRDAMLNIYAERKLKNAESIHLLFHEAYHNYIKSLYPCADQDAIILGGILMQLHQGDFDQRKAKSYLANDRSLHTLVPHAKLKNKSVNWPNKILAQYKHYSDSMANRDKHPQILQQHFLSICWNLTFYGCAFFTGYVTTKSKSSTSVYIGVNDLGIHIINAQTKVMLQSLPYKDIEWQYKETQPLLEVKIKGSSKGGQSVHTKQAGLISHLMTKMASFREGAPKLEG